MRAGAGCRRLRLILRHRATLPYLSKVPDVKKVKRLEQLALLDAERLAARCQESPDVLQAQELGWGDRKDSSVSEAPGSVQAV